MIKNNTVNRILDHFNKYKPLIHELVIRDLKVKYRRSFLGYLWSLLNPLLMMGVMSLVFSSFFRSKIENYPLYLICGQTLYGFFTESTNQAMGSILASGSLIRKIYIPKFIFPFSRIMSSFVTMSFSLAAILIVMIITRARFCWTILLIIIPIFFLFLFCCGLGMILSALCVYFRDIKHLWGVITLAWMYATPIFYSVGDMPAKIARIIRLNPLYHFITLFRSLVMFGMVPDAHAWLWGIGSGVAAFAIGLVVFGKLQKNFILYI